MRPSGFVFVCAGYWNLNTFSGFYLNIILPTLWYKSYNIHEETGLYYLQSRYYNPTTGRFLNADIYAATGQGLLGNNMFAYCGNNPTNCFDAAGYYQKYFNPYLGPALPGYGGGNATGASTGANSGATSGVTAAVAAISAVCTAACIEVKQAVQAATEKYTKRNNSVYVLKDDTGAVQYVGRTNDVDRRRAAHSANPARAGLQMEVVASELNLFEARALEQAGMAYHHTINTKNKMNNQINGIAPKYWGMFKSLALGTLDYTWNQMSNEILYWTGN